MLVEPKAAAVRPRVSRKDLDSREPVLLEELVADRLDRRDYGHVRLAGPRGSGASTALRHLAHLFRERSDVVVWDGVPSDEVVEHAATRLLVYANGIEPVDRGGDDLWQLAGWSTDDRIEYLLARHPQVEQRHGVFGHRLQRLLVVRASGVALTCFVQQPAQVAVRVSMAGIELDGAAVGVARFVDRADLELAAERVPTVGVEL